MKSRKVENKSRNSPQKRLGPAWLCLKNVDNIKPRMNHRARRGREIIHILNSVVFLLLRILRAGASNLDVIILKGSEKYSGQSLRVGYIGDMSNFHYTNGLFFQKNPDIIQSCKTQWWNIGSMTGKIKLNVDLMVWDLDFPLTSTVHRQDLLRVPRWVKQRVPVADTWEKVLAGLRRKTRKEALRLIRKFDFRARVVAGRESAGFFYERLYLPHILERYGKAAAIVSRARFFRECRKSEIIQLIQGNKILGAAVVRLSQNQLSIVWAGMATGLNEEECRGVTDALDLFSLLRAYEQGCKYLDMGPSRACINDGLLRYKRKWGAEIYRNKVPQGSLLIAPVTYGRSTLSVLEHTKWITQEKGMLTGRIFLPLEFDLNKLEQLARNEWVDGLEKLRIFVHGQVPEGIKLDRNRVEVFSYPTYLWPDIIQII